MLKACLLTVLVVSTMGCVAQVRGVRTQAAFYSAKAGTRVALASVDVPSWNEANVAKELDGRTLLTEGILKAFSEKPLQIADHTKAGVQIAIWPESQPILQPTATGTTEVGKPYSFGEDGMAHAVGAPPITWKVVKAPEGFTIDAASGRVQWTPSKLGEHPVELVATNRLGETKYSFSVNVVAPGKAGNVKLAKVPAPSIPADMAFGATFPTNLPASVDAPLLLGAQVVSWQVNIDPGTSSINRRVMADVVYSLWTRGGKLVDTTRVLLDQQALASYRNTPVFVPNRKSENLSWKQADQLPFEFAAFDQKLVRGVATMSPLAFAWPYLEHAVIFSVQLDESSPLLKPGILLSDKKDFEAAYQEFEKVAQANPQLSGALYNMGVMREQQGRDPEAAELYRRAIALKSDGMYQRQLTALEFRLKLYRPIELEAGN